MNSRLLIAFLCIASFSTGCIIEDNGCSTCHAAQGGDATFLWTFNGLRCDQARDVYGVNITIPGEALLNGGKYACSTAGVDGITLHDFAPGTYTFTLEAVDFRNVVVFSGTGTFVIDGNATKMVDLMPTGSPESTAYLNWRFPGNQSCFQAGVATVDIYLDDYAVKHANCADGQTAQGLPTPALDPGEHYIEFVAIDSAGHPLYYFNGGLTTQAYNPVNATYDLYTVGGASISWRFSNDGGSTTLDCPPSNPKVYVNFQDVNTGNWVYPGIGDGHDCSTKPIVYQFLRPGRYTVRIQTTINGYTYLNTPGTVDIYAHTVGVVPDITLYKQ